jgi:hypothetical protein
MSPLDEEYETLTRELRGLNTRLGLPEDDGIPQASSLNAEYEELMRENAALDQRLSSLPETFEEFTVRRKKEKERPLTEDITAFGSTLGEGAEMIAGQAKDFASELINRGLPVFTAGKVAADTGYVGGHDFARIAKTIGGAVMDKAYSEDEEIQREYERYLQNHDYNTKVRPAMLDKVENRAITEFGSNFVDPLMAFPVAGVASKMGSVTAKGLQKAATAGAMATRSQGLVKTARAAEGVAKGLGTTAKAIEKTGEVMALPTKLAAFAGRKALKGAALGGSLAAKGVALAGETTAKVAGTPRKLIAAAAAKVVPADMKNLAGASAFGGQLVGAMTGAVPGAAQLGIAEAAGFVAGKVGREVGYALDALSKRGGNGRFLYRLATNEAAAVTVRRAAMWAYTHAGTRLGDAAFNMAVNGASVGALNAALAWAADEPAEGMGAAAGAGALMGGVMPFGQPGLKGGKSQGARDAASIKNHIRNKVVADQRASFLKMPKASQVMIATLHEANVGAPKVVVLPKDVYLETFPDTSANYSELERKIYVNEGRLKKGSQQAVELMAHEVGHDFVHQSLGNDPAMLRMLLEPYETTADKGEAFYFQFDKESGNPIGEPIYLDETASAIRTDYDRRFPIGEAWKGIGKNASTLAKEIGADQFSMMFSENPNAFENFHPRLRRHLIDGLRKFLTTTGQAEPLTGNPLTNTVSKQLHRNPAIARLYRNYGKARSLELIEKGNQAEAGVVIEPRKGQTGEDRFTELFGGVGLSLTDAKSLSVSNKTLLRELLAIQERYKDDDAPQGWSVTERGGHLTGKELPDELRTIFTRSDRWGNVANLLDALQEAISQRIGIRFGYRSGTKGKYQNPFKIRDVGIYGWQVSPMRISGNKTRPSLKVLGYDEAKVRHNIQVLVEKGYVKDPQKFMADFAAQAQRALDDPEGRINPEGRKENELFTVAFGLKESADQIASPGLRELLESKAVKKSFVSFDVEALAGLAKGRESAFAFDYNNIRENYSPFFSTREFMPKQPDETIPLPFDELPGDKPGEGFGRMVNVDKTKSEMAEAKKLGEAQSGFSNAGTVRSKEAYGRDKLFMPAEEAGAPKGKQAEAAKLWQEKGTDSPYFKKWFGNSKVVDENGSPLVVYHGTGSNFTVMDPSMGELGMHFGTVETANERVVLHDTGSMPVRAIPLDWPPGQSSGTYYDVGDNIMPAYLKMENPYKLVSDLGDFADMGTLEEYLVMDGDNAYPFTELEFSKFLNADDVRQGLQNKGYDGITYENDFEGGGTSYIAFSSEQIKSATGNRGTFDASDPNMLFMPATPESLDVVQATDKDGNPKVRPKKDSKGELVPGEFVPVYESINYDLLDSPFIESYSQPSRGRPSADFDFDALDYDVTGPKREQILKAARSGALDAAADKVVSEYNRMVTDEQVAAGSGWYARMREKIAKALGDKAEFFAQLLGATSAQTPVEENFNQAYEAMTLARQGKYDSMVKRYLEMLDLVRRGKIEEVARKRGVVRLKDIKGKGKADRIKFIQNRWVERYNLIPLRSNGKKYNANSMAVMKVLAGVWLQTTKSPKTKNFSGNLSGRTIEATIDVWAARLLRRLLYDGQEKWRIQPASETGVSNHDFAVSQIIFRKAADKLNINPDDLQAIVWFGEKGVWDTNGWTGEVGAYKSSFDEPFDVYFPQGQKPRSMKEGQNIISFLRTERRVDKGRDMVDNPGRFGKTPDEANKFLRKGVNDAKKARTERGVEAFLRKRRRTAGR